MNLYLDDNNDIRFVDGDLPTVEGLEEIRQLVKQTLGSVKGEWFLDLDQGLPYFQTIFKKSTSLAAIESIYLEAIGNIPGILDITSFNMEFDPKYRKLNISFTANTTDGVLNFNS